MLKELINAKVDEIFVEYQNAHNITNGDINPLHAYDLEIAKDTLAEAIQVICNAQKNAINYDDFIPSWYIYTDYEGEAHSIVANALVSKNIFFTEVSKKICFHDLDDSTVRKIFYKGKEVRYAGWQPGMKYEYKDLDGNTIWVRNFPEWDH